MKGLGLRDKVIATFLGVAIGDALGMPFDGGMTAKKSGRVTSYVRPDGHRWFSGRGAGEWTDDTFFTLSVAESLIDKGVIDMDDLAKRHAEIYKSGIMKKIGGGQTTRKALKNLAEGKHWSASGIEGATGNGVVMKLSPLVACEASATAGGSGVSIYMNENYIREIVQFTKMTHDSLAAFFSSIYHAHAISWCLRHRELKSESDLINLIFEVDTISGLWTMELLGTSEEFRELSRKTDYLYTQFHKVRKLSDRQIAEAYGGGSAYVMDSLPFSYAFFLRKPNSIEALYDVVNAGGDTDTNGSIVGSLLGALNGTKIFPQHLIDGLWRKDEILKIANNFCDKFGIID